MSESMSDMSASPKTSIYWIYHWGARTICNHSKQLVGEEALPAHWQVGTSCPGPDDFRPAGLRPRPCHSSASAIECGPLIEHLEISKIYFPQHPHIILTVWDAVHEWTDSRWAFRKQLYSQFHKLHTPMMPWCALCILFWKWNPKIRDIAFLFAKPVKFQCAAWVG